MADLKSRIGRKVGESPHKTWIRPGFVPSPKKIGVWQQQHHRDTSGFGSDSSSHDDELFQGSSPVSPPCSPPSLFIRLGIPDQPMDDISEPVEPERPPRSLIERVGAAREQQENSFPSPTLKSARSRTSGDRMSSDSHKDHRPIETSQPPPKHTIKSEPIEAHLPKLLDSNNQAVFESDAVANEQNRRLSSQDNGAVKGYEINRPHIQDSNGFVDGPSTAGENGVVKSIPNSPNSHHPSSHLGDSTSHATHNNQSDNSLPLEITTSRRSDPEDGEVGAQFSRDQVRVVLLPLMLRNAENRKKETESKATSSQSTLDPNVVTDEACSTVVGTMNEVRKELVHKRELIHYSRSVWPSPEEHQENSFPGPPFDISSMGGPSRRRSTGHAADMDAYSDSSWNVPTPRRHIDSPPPSTSSNIFEPAHLHKLYGPPLRYTLSPEHPGFQPLHTRKQSTSQTAHDPAYEKRRSPSPGHSRKSSFSRGHPDNRRSTYEREDQPLPKSDNGWANRRPIEERENRPPDPERYARNSHLSSGSTSATRQEFFRESDHGWSERRPGREIRSPEPEHDVSRKPRYRSRSPPSPTFFPDRKMQRSPVARSRSPGAGAFSSNRGGHVHRDSGHSRRSSFSSYSHQGRATTPNQDVHDKEFNGRLASPLRRPSYGSYGPKGRADASRREYYLHDKESDRRSISPRRSYGFRGRSNTTGWDDLPIKDVRRSASPSRRGQYKRHDGDRRRSRTPPRYLRPNSPSRRRPPHRLPGRRSRSPDRRPRSSERMLTSDESASRSMSMSLSTESPRPSNLSKQSTIHDEPSKAMQKHLIPSYERNDTEHSSVESQNAVLACHRVPGLWFIKLASNALDILNCTFNIDHETAQKWNIPQINGERDDTTENVSLQMPRKLLSLQLCACSKQHVDEIYGSRGSDVTPEALAKAMFALKPSWPPQGHLIIVVNPESKRTRTWLPQDFGPTCLPSIENHVHEGQNVIQFIQLAGMAGIMFSLFARETQERVDDPPNSYDPEFLPLAEAGEAVNMIAMTPGTVTVSQIDSSS